LSVLSTQVKVDENQLRKRETDGRLMADILRRIAEARLAKPEIES